MITLVLGGARSGKSALAERLTMTLPAPVTYVATALADPGDADLAARIAAHRRRRPPRWSTVECGADLPGALAGIAGSVLVDALGTWVAAAPGFAADTGSLGEVLRRRKGDSVIVSDEVGLGVHPSTDAGRRFRDALGTVNLEVAEIADEVLLVVAGRALRLHAAEAVRR